MKNSRKATKVNTTIVTDSETGSILQTEQTSTFILPKEPEFVKMYVKDIGKMFDLTKSDDRVLLCITKYMAYNNMVCLVMAVKKMIMEELKMPLNTLNDSIRNLNESGLMERKAHGVYLINPNLFAKGKWEDIVKIRMEIEYSSKGKRITHIEVQNREVDMCEVEIVGEEDKRQTNIFDAIAQAEQGLH